MAIDRSATRVAIGSPSASSEQRSRIERLLTPHSIAVIGASSDPAKRGHQAVAALLKLGFPHPIYPVNPAGGTLLGLPVVRQIAEISEPVDLALVATPATTVPAILEQAAACGVGGAVVIAVGFAESGADGRLLEDRIADIAARSGMRVIGPNTSGIFNTHAAVNLVGVPDLPPGPISVLTQSGNMLLSLLEDTRAVGGPGLGMFVGVGNQTDVGFEDVIEAIARDSNTRVIAMHCEGFRDGRALLVELRKAATRKPVVILKGGTSDAGSRSALSHTAALAGSAVVSEAVLRQAGADLVQRSDELAAVASVLAAAPLPRGARTAVLADGGGHATLCADALSRVGLPLAELGPATCEQLRGLYGRAASVANPVDVAGATDEDPRLFTEGARLLLADEHVDLLVIVGLFGGYQVRFGAHLAKAEQAGADVLAGLPVALGKPAVVQSSYASHHTPPQRTLNAHGLPVLGSIDHAARAAAALVRRAHFVNTAGSRSTFAAIAADAEPSKQPAALRRRALTEPEARRLLGKLGDGVGTDRWRLVTSPGEAGRAVAQLGGRCAIKVVSNQIVHKSDVGGVLLDVTPAAAADAFAAIVCTVADNAPEATVDGVLVTPMAPTGVELMIGGSHDPTFGPMIAFGPGGTLVELLGQPAFRRAPITMLEASELATEQPISRLLDGYRGATGVDRPTLAQFLVEVSKLIAGNPEIAELDLNPVIAAGPHLVPVDARIVVWERG
ncbi:MAG: acetate--CoA ligase family protein [Solirubrobacteraceae bacterium]